LPNLSTPENGLYIIVLILETGAENILISEFAGGGMIHDTLKKAAYSPPIKRDNAFLLAQCYPARLKGLLFEMVDASSSDVWVSDEREQTWSRAL